ncbi:MAG: hypothetical protein Q8R00_05155 [Candidatus Nanoarchaeia archaeon]|nr:hypothetical protein [Candidatus Nanoarchaeia archaeon]
MTSLNIHLHEFDSQNKGGIEKLIELASLGPITISLAPLHLREERYDKNFLSLIKGIVNQKGNSLGQRGDTNFCVRKYHKRLDKFHENRCPYSLRKNPLEVQFAFMERGKNNLVGTFDKEPEIYTPPNHFYDEDTIKAAKQLDFTHFSVYDVLGIKPSYKKSMTFVPERSCHLPRLFDRLSKPYAIHTHLGHLIQHWNKFKILELESLQALKPNKSFFVKRVTNSLLKYTLKYWRDITNLVSD